MSFAWPHLLWLLALPTLLLVWDITHRRRVAAAARPNILRAEAGARSLRLTSSDAPAAAGSSRPRFWLYAGLALAGIAVARPQWGRLEEPVFDQSREILLAIDLSRSMLTPDVKPSRLERAKLLIESLLEKLSGERGGLVVFSGTAFLQSPLSADYEILREFLPALNPNFLPEGGTNYGALLETSIQAFGSSGSADRFMIVLSDGEATDTEWKSKMEELKKKNIRVLGLGVGTAGGAMIPDGSGQFVKDERGAVVLSKLESATLQELAQATGGVYRDASAWVDLAALVKETIESGQKGEFVEKNTIRLVERYQWPLALGLWCFLFSVCYEFPVRPRPRDVKLATAPAVAKAAGSLAATSLIALLLFAPVPAVRAAATLAPAATGAGPTSMPKPGAAPAEPSALAKVVGRLSAAEKSTARDWAELGRETATWGSRLNSEKQPVPEGPVRDALAAADLGAKLDAKATDWPKLREELEALLKQPDEDKKDQDKQDKQDKNDQPQNKDQKKQDQKSDPQKQQDQNPQQSSDQQDKSKSQEQPQDAKSDQKPSDDSAFGDMNKKQEPPPPPPQDMQKVGGAPERKPQDAQEKTDPNLALPLQKLDQLRQQDSPAQLFQLMEGDKKGPRKTGKDW